MNRIVTLRPQLNFGLLLSLVVFAISFSPYFSHAQFIVAQDDASNYGGDWTNGSNGGNGFGAWDLSSGGTAGWFLGDPSAAGVTGMANPSFGLWANPEGSNFVNADRTFLQPLQVGHTFSFEWGVNWESGGSGNKGFSLYNGGTGGDELININMGGNATIFIEGSPMFSVYGTQAMTIHFEVVSATELRVHATGRDGIENYDENFTISGLPDSFRFYASGLASGVERQPYFNNLQVTSPTLDITWANLQFPQGGTIMPGDSEFFIYARVEVPGLTNQPQENDQINAWIGFNNQNTNPSTWDDDWYEANFLLKINDQNRHEFVLNAADYISDPGTYYYASRFRVGDSGPFVYGGIDDGSDNDRGGIWAEGDNVSGVLRFGKNSAQSGNWSETTTWQGGVVPVPGEHVFILSGHNVTLDDDAQVNSLTIQNNASLIVPDNQERDFTIGPDGTFTNNGIFTAGNQGTVVLNGTSNVAGTSVTTFNNVTVEGLNVSLGEAPQSRVQGILDLRAGNIGNAPELLENSTLRYSQGGPYLRVTEWDKPWNVQVSNETVLDLNINEFLGNLSMRGDLIIDANSTVFVDAGHTKDFIVEGDVVLNGTLTLSNNIGSDLFVGGDWIRTGTFNPNNRLVTFNGSTPQTLTGHTTFNYLTIADGAELILNDGITMSAPLVVENGAVLNVNTQIIDGNGSFNLDAGGTLRIGSLDGIELSGDVGNIRTAGRNFSDQGIYHYIGEGDQWSGNALPVNNSSKVIIVELSGDDNLFRLNTNEAVFVQDPGRVEIRSGTFLEGATSSALSGRSVRGTGNLVMMTGGIFRFERTFGSTSDIRFPRLSGLYSDGSGGDLLGTIVLAGNDDHQFLRSGRTYNNLLFTGAGTKVIPNATPDINGTVTIEDGVVDVGVNTFGNNLTGLTMTGGRLILQGARTLPDMEGAYDLTGGTIEFAGNSPNHRIRGGKTYHNIDVSGSVNNPNANVNVRENGVFLIKDGGSFTITNVAVEGAGSFVMEDFSTLFYGSPNGITLQVEGTGTDKGNIRTQLRSFNSQAHYGFAGGSHMVTGSGLPSTVRSLQVRKSEDRNISLTQPLVVLDELILELGKLITANDNFLHLNNVDVNRLIAGVGNDNFLNSYIIGPFTRSVDIVNNNAYVFPVGRDEGVQTATVTFKETVIGSGKTLTARFRTNIPDNFYGNLPQTFNTQLINTLSEEGFWQIDAENITTTNYDISLFARDFDWIYVPEGIRILKRLSGGFAWELAGSHDNHTIFDEDFIFNHTGINSFSEFALGGDLNNNPLPVDWLSFDVRPVDGTVQLNWTTATEVNNDFFTVLRSGNGIDFEPLYQLPGAGNSNQLQHYTFTDVAPMDGINYYRIRQTDFDGTADYSRTLAVQTSPAFEARIFAYSQQLHFHLPTVAVSDIWSYRIFNINGQLIASGTIPAHEGLSHYKLNASQWRGELLMVSLSSSREVVHERVVVR